MYDFERIRIDANGITVEPGAHVQCGACKEQFIVLNGGPSVRYPCGEVIEEDALCEDCIHDHIDFCGECGRVLAEDARYEFAERY